MPWQNTKNKYRPVSDITPVGIQLSDTERIKEAFKYNHALYEFYVRKKLVYRTYLVLFIRSMRINEFLDLLDHLETPWTILDDVKF